MLDELTASWSDTEISFDSGQPTTAEPQALATAVPRRELSPRAPRFLSDELVIMRTQFSVQTESCWITGQFVVVIGSATEETALDELLWRESLRERFFEIHPLDWEPETRIAWRHNNNRRKLARLKKGTAHDLSISQIKSDIIRSKGQPVWDLLVKNESERQASDRWHAAVH